MPTEEEEILARIDELAGQINKHKKASVSLPAPAPRVFPSTNPRPFHYHAWQPPHRGGHASSWYNRGGRNIQVYRNKSLVLNNGTSTTPTRDTTPDNHGPPPPSAKRFKEGPTFVSKTDRHMQLINTDIYEKEANSRAKAIADSHKQKLARRDQRERVKLQRHFQRHFQRSTGPRASVASVTTAPLSNYEVDVEGIRFRVAKNGSKLLKLPGDPNSASATPKLAMVGGVRFHRSKNGNLYRAGVVRAHRRTTANAKINEPCKTFSSTGICAEGLKCRYMHDAAKVAICKEYLLKGVCPSGDACDLSHEASPERTPACLHFAKGHCANADCRYSHIRVSPGALVCRAFALYGYCERGSACEERHIHECPDFSNTGACKNHKCKLPHRLKANVMRKNAVLAEPSPDEAGDVSSEEESDEIGSDDVDSDDLEEDYTAGREGLAPDVDVEQDYLEFS